jgi:hypothetical protein
VKIRVFAWLLITVACGVASSGCQGLSRYRECKRVAAAANPAIEEIKSLDSGDENAALGSTYAVIAERYRALDKTLEALEPELSADFKQGVTTFRTQVRTAARESERYRDGLDARARASDAKDEKAISSADNTLKLTRERMGKTERTYAGAVDRLALLCVPPG